MIKKLWNNQENRPITAKPKVAFIGDKVKITCVTQGASIGYKVNPKAYNWNVYSEPFEIKSTENDSRE